MKVEEQAAIASSSSLALVTAGTITRLMQKALSLALVCSAVLTSTTNIDGVMNTVTAFSPSSYHRAVLPSSSSSLPLPFLTTRRSRFADKKTYSQERTTSTTIPTTSLAYKHREEDEEDSPEVSSFDSQNNRNETNDISKSDNNVIYYNDLDPEVVDAVLSSSYSASFTTAETDDFEITELFTGGDAVTGSELESQDTSASSKDDPSNGLIKELEDAITAKKIKAIEPSETKPAKKFVSPIQMIKKVPKVEPIHMSTVFFLKLIGDPMWTGGTTGSSNDPSGSKQDTTSAEKKKKKNKPVIESWKDKMLQGKKSTAFMATNYLEALTSTPGDNDTKNDDSDEDNKDDMLAALREQQAKTRREAHEARQKAFIEANRRTNPKDVVAKRNEKEQAGRKRKEREKLERLYVERKERLDAKKRNEEMYAEQQAKEREILEGKKKEREDEAALVEANSSEGSDSILDNAGDDHHDDDASIHEEMPINPTRIPKGKRGIPILDILSRPPVVDAPPLLVGSTVTFSYDDLTPFQKRAVDVARGYHEEHLECMQTEEEGCDVSELLNKAGDEGGIQAAPIVAIIDSYTAAAMEAEEAALPQQQSGAKKRFATIAAIKVVESDFDNGPSVVRFMGVSRVFLHSYFSSKDAGLTVEEEELNQLLARIQQFDKEDDEEFDEEDHDTVTFASEYEEEDEEEEDLPVVLAEFDIFLDDSSILSKEDSSTKYGEDVSKKRASSMHAITELYRTANMVYRMHEERKKLVAGLRAGVARLSMGKKRIADMDDENCLVEYEDCDGLGLIGGLVAGDASSNFVEDDVVAPSEDEGDVPIRSRLESMDNYGFGSYGILSTIPDLTDQLASQLEPYYSPTHREREEYDAEVASMVVFQTLQEYASPDEIALALLAPSATNRLEMAHSIMMRHAEELNDLVRKISEELMDCGEECTDLW